MRLTRKPYTRQEFAVLLQDVKAAQGDADLQAALRSVARFLEKDRPLEAFINIGYQQVRHPALQRVNTAHLYRVEPKTEKEPSSVTTGVFDLLELAEMEHERREGRGSYTHGGELCIIFLTAPCGEHVNTGFADACPVETMQDLPLHVLEEKTACIDLL
jgi:hypothetical protein